MKLWKTYKHRLYYGFCIIEILLLHIPFKRLPVSIEKFFTALDDGKWHSIDELADQVGIQSSKITKLSELLAEYGIIEYQDNARRIKIEQPWRYLFPEEELTEPRSILATFVLPPRTSIDFQSTYISNISNFKIELSIRFNGKIEEMTVNF